MPPSDPVLVLPDKPSVAVLPFHSPSGDVEAQTFADGLSEHLAYTLACTPGLFVSASGSSFTFRSPRTDPREVGRKLGVAHVLQGTIEADANDIVISARLTLAAEARELWSERAETTQANAVAGLNQIVDRTVATIAPGLAADRTGFARARFPAGVGIYARFLSAYATFATVNEQNIRSLLDTLAAIARTIPDQPLPPSLMAQCYTRLVAQGWSTDPDADAAAGCAYARAALSKPGARQSPIVLRLTGNTLGFLGQDFDVAVPLIARSIALNPNSSASHERGGWVQCYVGEARVAEEYFRAAQRLSPLDRDTFLFDSGLGLALCMQGRHEEAVPWLQRAMDEKYTWTTSHRVLAASLAHLGRLEEAAATVRTLMRLQPNYRVARALQLYRASPGKDILVEGLRRAGVPE